MHRSALMGSLGLTLIVIAGLLIVPQLVTSQQASAETKPVAPSRFSAANQTKPLSQQSQQPGSFPKFYGKTRLVSDENPAPSSRRRVYNFEPEEKAEAKPDTNTKPVPKGLPSSLEDALNRLDGQELPAMAAEKSVEPTQTPAPQANAPTSRRPAASTSPADNRYNSSTLPTANGAASITQQPRAENPSLALPRAVSEPQPTPSAAPTTIPMETASEQPQQTLPTEEPARLPNETPRHTFPIGEQTVVPGDTSLFRMTTPVIDIQTTGPTSLVLGKPGAFRIEIRNMGQVDARELTFNIELPQGVEVTELRSSTGTPSKPQSANGSSIQWDVPVLPVRGNGTLELHLLAKTTRPVELSVVAILPQIRETASVSILEPKLALAFEGPRDVLFGDSQVFKLVAHNPGTGPADNVSITIMPIKKGQAPTVIDTIGTIPPGEKRELELELTAKQAGGLSLRATSKADGGLVSDAAHDVLVRRAEIAVSANGPGIKYAATNAIYDLTIANSGNAPAENVVIMAQLPTGAKFVSASNGGQYDEANHIIRWKLDTLASSAQHPLQIVSTLMTEGNNVLQTSVQANQGLKARNELLTRVQSVADLKLTVNDPPGPIPVDQPVEYEFRLTNRGTKEARGVQLFVSFDSGIQPMKIENSNGTITGDQIQFATIPSIAAGQELVLKVTARGRADGNHTFRAEVQCSDPSTRLAIEESTHFYGKSIQTASPALVAPKASTPTEPISPAPYSRYQ